MHLYCAPTRRPMAYHRISPYPGLLLVTESTRNVFSSRGNEFVVRSSFRFVGSLFHARGAATEKATEKKAPSCDWTNFSTGWCCGATAGGRGFHCRRSEACMTERLTLIRLRHQAVLVGTGQMAEILCGWEGNRRSDISAAILYRLRWVQGPRKRR